jgi:hypothetical protein
MPVRAFAVDEKQVAFALLNVLFDKQGNPIMSRVVEIDDVFADLMRKSRIEIVGRSEGTGSQTTIRTLTDECATAIQTHSALSLHWHLSSPDCQAFVHIYPAGEHRVALFLTLSSEQFGWKSVQDRCA